MSRTRDSITREFWTRVRERNGIAPECVPPPRIPVDIDEDDRGPMALVALVFLVLIGALAFGVYALGSHFGWIAGIVAVVGAAFAPVGGRS